MGENRFKKGIENIVQPHINENQTEIIEVQSTKNNSNDLLDNLFANDKLACTNKTFYLSGDVIKAIETVAKEKKIAKSKLVDTILREFLIK